MPFKSLSRLHQAVYHYQHTEKQIQEIVGW